MKLFIWCDPYKVPYGSSMLLAVAETEELARAEAAKGKHYTFGQYETAADFSDLAMQLGKPDRMVDLPCAEWHEWSE